MRPVFVLMLSGLVLLGCGGPFLVIPGGELSGEVVADPVADWSFLDAAFVDLETRPDDPYSVELNYVVRDGKLYIDPAEGRNWLEHIRADPRVRVRFGEQIYPLEAVLVGRPGELEGFDSDRFIYQPWRAEPNEDSMIKVHDIAYVRFAAPDLDVMERFLVDFGLVPSRSENAIYARGTDPSPYLHVTEQGEPAFLGAAFEAASAEDLVAASKLDGASAIEKLDAPGGGQRVRFTDPDGYVIDIVHGRQLLEPLPPRRAEPFNLGDERKRKGVLQRVQAGPSCVKRLGHVVVRVSDFRRSEQWYKSRFGFLSSDEIYLGEKENVITAFMRCDRGEDYSDHHTFLCVGLGEPGFDHAAFEVEDIDAVMLGHDHLTRAGYDHHAGIGRHVLGSQVFDYWKDPWGNVVEHFTDGDLLNASHSTELHDPGTALGTQWGKFSPA